MRTFQQSAMFLLTVTGIAVLVLVAFLGGYQAGYSDGNDYFHDRKNPPLSTPFRATMVERYGDVSSG
jgi:ABC-type antimicrobial peptide transport system permease subunit